MSEENMRMILDELKQTRKDNEKLQDLLKKLNLKMISQAK